MCAKNYFSTVVSHYKRISNINRAKTSSAINSRKIIPREPLVNKVKTHRMQTVSVFHTHFIHTRPSLINKWHFVIPWSVANLALREKVNVAKDYLYSSCDGR